MPKEEIAQDLLMAVQVRCRCNPVGNAALTLAGEIDQGMSKKDEVALDLSTVVGNSCFGERNDQCQFPRRTEKPIAEEIVDTVHKTGMFRVR